MAVTKIIWASLACIMVLLMAGCVLNTEPSTPTLSVSEVRAKAIEVPYSSLMRNNEAYVGKIIHFEGRIVQVSEIGTDRFVLRIATGIQPYLGYSDDIIWVNYRGKRVLEDDIISIYGQVKGLETYRAILGNQVTIPKVDALYSELRSMRGE